MNNFKNLGKALNRIEQKSIFGGSEPIKHAREEEECTYDYDYHIPCPVYTSNSDGGCWATVVTCGSTVS